MGFFSHRVGRSEIIAGDHIYTYRAGFTYSHHGIYVGNDRVVHFKPAHGVIKSCVHCFLSGGSLHRYEYATSEATFVLKRGGTCTTAKSDAPELAVSRAMKILDSRFREYEGGIEVYSGGFGEYNLVLNNCEHFALYCKTSLRTIRQRSTGGSGQVTGFAGTCVAVLDSCGLMAVPRLLGIASSAVLGPVGTAIGAGIYSHYRLEKDFGVRKDVVRVEVEDLVPFRLFKPEQEPRNMAVYCVKLVDARDNCHRCS